MLNFLGGSGVISSVDIICNSPFNGESLKSHPIPDFLKYASNVIKLVIIVLDHLSQTA